MQNEIVCLGLTVGVDDESVWMSVEPDTVTAIVVIEDLHGDISLLFGR
jgi:hypothetical protein